MMSSLPNIHLVGQLHPSEMDALLAEEYMDETHHVRSLQSSLIVNPRYSLNIIGLFLEFDFNLHVNNYFDCNI